MTLPMAPLIDAIPRVANTTDRAYRFPTPMIGQRVHRVDVKRVESWNGSSWTQDWSGQVFGINGADYGTTSTDIAAAIAAAIASGCKLVTLPGATYTFTGVIPLTNAHNGLKIHGAGPWATMLSKGYSGPLFTLDNAAYVEFHDLSFHGQHGTYTGTGIEITGANSDRPVFHNCLFIGFTDSAVKFGADAGQLVSMVSCDFEPGSGQTDYRAIHVNGPDTAAAFRRFLDVRITLGYIDLDGAQDTLIQSSVFRRIEDDANCTITSVLGCVWANASTAMTLNGANYDVVGCRFSGDITLASTFTGNFKGNTQTAGTFTDNTTGANATVHHHPLTANHIVLNKNTLLVTKATERVLTNAIVTPGDAALSASVASTPSTILYATTLTADRAITLSTTSAVNGDQFRVTRSAAGAFNLDVGGLKTLAAGEWCVVTYNGSAWVLTQFGALS